MSKETIDNKSSCHLSVVSKRTETNDGFLQFAVCGDNAELYVRETSVDNSVSNKDDCKDIEEQSVVGAASLSSGLTILSGSLVSERGIKKTGSKSDRKYQPSARMPGQTYFEEEVRNKQYNKYKREMDEALRRTCLWKSFQRDQAKYIKKQMIRLYRPHWWQEPSQSQIILATSLGAVIVADNEEGVTGRTRQWLLDLGVVSTFASKEIKECMRRSLLQPVDFLLEIHAVIISQNKEMKNIHDKSFSVDERLVLSAMCILQLPTMLIMLSYIMPSANPLPKERHRFELLYGDLEDEGIRYATPYMEPLPFRNQEDFQNWAFGAVLTSLLPSIIGHIQIQNLSGITMRNSLNLNAKRSSFDSRMSSTSLNPSVMWLITQCLPSLTPSLNVEYDDSLIERYNIHQTSFSRQLSEKILLSERRQRISMNTSVDRSIADTLSTLTPSANISNERSDLHKKVKHRSGSIPSNNLHSQTTSVLTDTAFQTLEASDKNYGGQYYGSQNKANETEQNIYSIDGRSAESEPKETDGVFETQRTSFNRNEDTREGRKGTQFVKNTDNKKSLKRSSANRESFSSKHADLARVQKEIEELPINKRLQHAIQLLSDMGDPLAQLPDVDKLPSVKRWFELRQGNNRFLTKKNKNDLLEKSKYMWNSSTCNNLRIIPKIKLSDKKKRQLTWDDKQWLTSKLVVEKQSYFSKVRKEKVDHARLFFPSTVNHYDYGSKLNRNFRNVFYTYLPAREADTKVYRPWQSQEKKELRC